MSAYSVSRYKFNPNKFKAAIVKGNEGDHISQRDIAESLQISLKATYNKLNGRSEFSISEVLCLVNDFNIDVNDIKDIWGN